MYGSEEGKAGHYAQSDTAIQAAAASPHQLVLMLFNGLADELIRTRGHIAARRYERKAQSINKCIDILNALTSALDFDKGGELSLSLASLYDYCVYRLYDASLKLEVEYVDEVITIISELKYGWDNMGKKHG